MLSSHVQFGKIHPTNKSSFNVFFFLLPSHQEINMALFSTFEWKPRNFCEDFVFFFFLFFHFNDMTEAKGDVDSYNVHECHSDFWWLYVCVYVRLRSVNGALINTANDDGNGNGNTKQYVCVYVCSWYATQWNHMIKKCNFSNCTNAFESL